MNWTNIRDLPFKLIALAVILMLAANIYELRRTAGSLNDTLNAQSTILAGSPKIEMQLSALAKGTKQLADSGNANAKGIVNTLSANGVNIN